MRDLIIWFVLLSSLLTVFFFTRGGQLGRGFDAYQAEVQAAADEEKSYKNAVEEEREAAREAARIAKTELPVFPEWPEPPEEPESLLNYLAMSACNPRVNVCL